MIEMPTKKLITAKQAEAYVPSLSEMVGNYKIRDHFHQCLMRPVESDANVMIEGEPGSGKSIGEIAYLRERVANPDLYGPDMEKAVEEAIKWGRNPQISEYDLRLWQLKTDKVYAHIRIDGATDTKATIEHKVQDVLYEIEAVHKLVILDEAGELYWRGLEEALRPMLTDPEVTTYANAQNFHSKRKGDSKKEEEDRLRAFLRRFTHFFRTENPSADELLVFLARRMKEWEIKLDKPATLRHLIRKSGCVVGYALRALIKAIDEPDRMVTRDLVERYDVDPLNH